MQWSSSKYLALGLGLLGIIVVLAVRCDVEPIPSISEPGNFVVSSADGSSDQVAAIGRGLSVPAESTVRVTNGRTQQSTDVVAASDGSFAVNIPAIVGDELGFRTVSASGKEGPTVTEIVKSAMDSGVPETPGKTGTVTVSPPKKGLVGVTGTAGTVKAGVRVTVGNTTRSVGAELTVKEDGSVFGLIDGQGGDEVVLVVSDGEKHSAAGRFVVPPPTGDDDTDTDTVSAGDTVNEDTGENGEVDAGGELDSNEPVEDSGCAGGGCEDVTSEPDVEDPPGPDVVDDSDVDDDDDGKIDDDDGKIDDDDGKEDDDDL